MRKGLRIYLPFAANELKRQLAYKGAFYLFIHPRKKQKLTRPAWAT